MDSHAVCSANIGRCLDASVATRTKPACVPHAAAWRARGARRAAESQGHSAAPQPSPGFEYRQAARVGGGQGFFERLLRRQVACPEHRQQAIGPHGQCHMAIPPCPTADFILIQPDFPFGRCKATLHGLPAPGHPHHRLQRARVGRKHHVGCQVCGIAHTASPNSHRRHAGCMG
jgi:hypothetical protein